MAMKMGKHVYVEKPMAHTVCEARRMTQVAKETGVVTQMGNQGHGGEGLRLYWEFIHDGAVPLTYGRALGGNPVGEPSGRSRWESPVGERRPASKEHGSPAVMRGALQGEHIARRWLRPNERERTGAE
jgi:predicted dehydrogenase